MRARTSLSHPLRIAGIEVPAGRLGITLCPGKKGASVFGAPWDRDLARDMAAIRDWGARALVTLIEEHEFAMLKVEDLPRAARAAGLDWLHLPIRDVDVPGPGFEAAWRAADLAGRLARGEAIAVHCRGGLGRAGLVAARLLVEAGMAPQEAIDTVRAARPGAIETAAQENYVRALG